MADKAQRISEFSSNAEVQESAANDLVGMKLDAITAKANLGVVKVSSEILQEFVQDTLKK